MEEQIEIVKEKHGFNYGKLYIWLLEAKLSAKAKLVWGVMDSFGSESRAGNKAICRRSSLTKPTLRLAQEELIKNNWLELLAEATPKNPQKWLLKIPDQVKLLAQGGKAALPGVVKPLSPKQEDKQERKQEDTANAASTPFLKADRAIAIFCKTYKTVRDKKYSITGKDIGALKVLLKNDYEADGKYFGEKVSGYLKSKDPFVIGQAHSLSLFCSQFNKWPTSDTNDNGPTPFSELAI